MTQLEKLETMLDESLNKKAPFKIPENGRKSLANAFWWIALVVGVLQLYAAWLFWHAAHAVNALIDYSNAISAAYGGPTTTTHLGLFYYLALLVLLVDGAILLLAAPGLKAMRKSGWNLLFYSLLVNVVYGVVALFTSYGGFSHLLSAVVGSVVGAYLLFQVRDRFMKSDAAEHHKAKA